ncbi:hypothetical protein CCR75_002992 [Bremia lactucae]|uniref:Uncharacterized protein n=1 Tax=Bremia lactucae TaxID=4779 RepID=A0A976FEK4_BRELC|nr:hypothetical protein CCR75_002992 [Bremia lactucae]
MEAFELIEHEIDKEICDTVSALEILRPLPIDEFVSPRDEDSGIHCAGLDEMDFVFSVPDNLGHDAKQNSTKKASASSVKQHIVGVPTELSPRLQELHARIEASASSASAAVASGLNFTPTLTTKTVGENIGSSTSTDSSIEDALGLSSSDVKSVDEPATNEQLVACFRVLLPELDRLRFDDHAKKSIRTTFRKLKETVEQHALDRKRGTMKTIQAVQPFQSPVQQMQPLLHEQQGQTLQEMQRQHIQTMQLLMQPDQQPQELTMASEFEDHSIL